jgi:hypothetical protein
VIRSSSSNAFNRIAGGGGGEHPAAQHDVRFMVGAGSLSISAAAVTTSFRPRSCPQGVLMHCDMRLSLIDDDPNTRGAGLRGVRA